jgi:hypothetical protein
MKKEETSETLYAVLTSVCCDTAFFIVSSSQTPAPTQAPIHIHAYLMPRNRFQSAVSTISLLQNRSQNLLQTKWPHRYCINSTSIIVAYKRVPLTFLSWPISVPNPVSHTLCSRRKERMWANWKRPTSWSSPFATCIVCVGLATPQRMHIASRYVQATLGVCRPRTGDVW